MKSIDISMLLLFFTAPQTLSYLQRITRTEVNAENGCSNYKSLFYFEGIVNELGVLREVEHILAYVKTPFYGAYEHTNAEPNEYILRMCCIVRGQESIEARSWMNVTEFGQTPQPEKPGCNYPFFTEAVVSYSHGRDIMKPYIEYSVCASKSTCHITATIVDIKPGQKGSSPAIFGCTFSVYKPLFAIPAYLDRK
ncbi:hypothetical protein AX774_g466 [Zancudomyces culisetae]|uniref:Uncharacterized protein n=1 Tax=Zancudomyces culisetae TaxID=1213189 RepID=A0A1R1PYG2_ZANCU|nr:hypothetical protein AX774_g466 [Zancudomyces culisetae]|eukprot:OMH86002.1 hypothetical protein AX774_g466 [Zancudomyces culisetae]